MTENNSKKMTKKLTKNPPSDSFEEALEKLKTIAEKLESSDLSLDEALEHYREGVAHVKTCQTALNKSEKKIKILQKESDHLEEFEFNEDN